MTTRLPPRRIRRGGNIAVAIALALGPGAYPLRAADSAADIAGPWLTAGRASVVRFDPCGSGWCGRIAQVLKRQPGAATLDIRNPDPARRTQPIEGLQLLTLVRFESGAWRGTVYDPRTGQTYKALVRRSGPAQLEIRGCIAFLCQSQQWSAP